MQGISFNQLGRRVAIAAAVAACVVPSATAGTYARTTDGASLNPISDVRNSLDVIRFMTTAADAPQLISDNLDSIRLARLRAAASGPASQGVSDVRDSLRVARSAAGRVTGGVASAPGQSSVAAVSTSVSFRWRDALIGAGAGFALAFGIVGGGFAIMRRRESVAI
jgi:hypothetical protein